MPRKSPPPPNGRGDLLSHFRNHSAAAFLSVCHDSCCNVPRGTIQRFAHIKSATNKLDHSNVSRETSCANFSPLLHSLCGGFIGQDYCHHQPEGWCRQDNHGS